MTPIPDELLEAVKGTYTGLATRLREVDYTWTEDGLTVTGSYHYLAFRDGVPTLDEFVEFIYWKIVPFCIPRRERNEKRKKYQDTGDERYIHELTDKAKNLFIRARQKAIDKARLEGIEAQFTSGEPGELILFMLLEAIRSAPQIACKMYLKTSEDMPVHGSDSVHIAKGSAHDRLLVIWGESKLYQQLSTALDEICNSIASFIADEGGRANRDRDIDIMRDHMDVEDPTWKEALIRYFDPYEEASNQREEGFACFVGFDFSAYQTIAELPPAERESRFAEHYVQRIESACSLFAEKIRAHGLTHLRVDFFLIPFESVATLREKFLLKLGIVP